MPLSIEAQGYDFERNRNIQGYQFNKPQYDAGIKVRVQKYVSLGARVEDIIQKPRVMTWAKLTFEDKDLSYLFGLATFGAAGTKGRSSNGSSSH
jgi:hypothetical protein